VNKKDHVTTRGGLEVYCV